MEKYWEDKEIKGEIREIWTRLRFGSIRRERNKGLALKGIPEKWSPGNSETKNRGVGVEHRGVCAWNVRV